MNLSLKNLKILFLCPFFILLGSIITLSVVQIESCDKSQLTEVKRHYTLKSTKNPILIVSILSAPKNLERRNVIRETWLSQTDNDIIHYFLIGSSSLSTDLLLQLSAEQSKYNDLLILPVEESYSKLTNKVLKTFTWFDDQIKTGLNFSYLLKCDDDSFVRLDMLMKEIKILQNRLDNKNFVDIDEKVQSVNIQGDSNKELSVYWGYFKGNANIKTQGKWKESNWILCNNYLPYAQGGGYLLSKKLVTYIAKNAEDLSLYNSEDVSVGTWLAPVTNLVRIHDVRFDTEWISRGCQNSHIIFHNIPMSEMKSMHSNIKKHRVPCTEITIKRKKYLYDWNTHPANCCKQNI